MIHRYKMPGETDEQYFKRMEQESKIANKVMLLIVLLFGSILILMMLSLVIK